MNRPTAHPLRFVAGALVALVVMVGTGCSRPAPTAAPAGVIWQRGAIEAEVGTIELGLDGPHLLVLREHGDGLALVQAAETLQKLGWPLDDPTSVVSTAAASAAWDDAIGQWRLVDISATPGTLDPVSSQFTATLLDVARVAKLGAADAAPILDHARQVVAYARARLVDDATPADELRDAQLVDSAQRFLAEVSPDTLPDALVDVRERFTCPAAVQSGLQGGATDPTSTILAVGLATRLADALGTSCSADQLRTFLVPTAGVLLHGPPAFPTTGADPLLAAALIDDLARAEPALDHDTTAAVIQALRTVADRLDGQGVLAKPGGPTVKALELLADADQHLGTAQLQNDPNVRAGLEWVVRWGARLGAVETSTADSRLVLTLHALHVLDPQAGASSFPTFRAQVTQARALAPNVARPILDRALGAPSPATVPPSSPGTSVPTAPGTTEPSGDGGTAGSPPPDPLHALESLLVSDDCAVVGASRDALRRLGQPSSPLLLAATAPQLLPAVVAIVRAGQRCGAISDADAASIRAAFGALGAPAITEVQHRWLVAEWACTDGQPPPSAPPGAPTPDPVHLRAGPSFDALEVYAAARLEQFEHGGCAPPWWSAASLL